MGQGRTMSKFQFIDADVEQVQLDVSDCSSIQSAVTQIEETAGKIDILVNNAGQGCVGPLAEVDFDKARQTFDINVLGLLAVTQAVTPGMMSRRNGLVYCATKACVTSMSDVLRMELEGFGVRVMCVYPGAIKSSIGEANAKAFIARPDSRYANVGQHILARATWSQCPQSTPTSTLAEEIVRNALKKSPPANLSAGYRSSSAWWSYYLPYWIRDRLWATQFGIAEVAALRAVLANWKVEDAREALHMLDFLRPGCFRYCRFVFALADTARIPRYVSRYFLSGDYAKGDLLCRHAAVA
ncbi:hypothetical protein IEQ34_025141 [Dendrobium chrysotoxum]|uniref:Uncharacterized protein n=1 Tax=Dendrobium chrysotoxum TaxID=161865 RepID=A0AAV7FRN3_DENCH|nr:hypothetical protein IEQ34_025141 [Dendrobium chrysotoxum]